MFNFKREVLSIPALVTRLSVGFVFAYGAWDKFQDIDTVIAQFSQTGLPFVAPLTYLVCSIELVAGLLLIVGFLTRWAAGPLIVIELIAAFAVKSHLMTNLANALNLTEFLYTWLFLWLMVFGPGHFSVDHFLSQKKQTDP